jgi:hypothetical protein
LIVFTSIRGLLVPFETGAQPTTRTFKDPSLLQTPSAGMQGINPNTNREAVLQEAVCNDRIDNDRDGLIDYLDRYDCQDDYNRLLKQLQGLKAERQAVIAKMVEQKQRALDLTNEAGKLSNEPDCSTAGQIGGAIGGILGGFAGGSLGPAAGGAAAGTAGTLGLCQLGKDENEKTKMEEQVAAIQQELEGLKHELGGIEHQIKLVVKEIEYARLLFSQVPASPFVRPPSAVRK